MKGSKLKKNIERVRNPPPLPEIDDATRREFLIGAGALLVIAPFGCGGEESGESAQTTSPGESNVPSASALESVIVLEGRRDLETSLALGLPVVGAPAASPDEPFSEHLGDRVADVEPLFARGEPNLEAIAAQEPDLILSREGDPRELGIKEDLTTIAPLLTVSAGEVPWQRDLRSVADTLGVGERAEQLITDYEGRVSEVAARHEDVLDRPLAVVQYTTGGNLYWSAPDGFLLQPKVLADVGGQFVEAQKEAGYSEDWSQELIDERLSEAAGILLITALEPEAELAELDDLELWQQLDAVQSGVVETVPFQLNYGSVIAANVALDAMDSLLAKLFEATG